MKQLLLVFILFIACYAYYRKRKYSYDEDDFKIDTEEHDQIDEELKQIQKEVAGIIGREVFF